MHWFLVISFALVGLLFVGISIPLVLRRIPPNETYGFRVRKTLDDPGIWYRANEYSGRWLMIAGAVITLASSGLGMSTMSDYAYVVSMVLVMTVSLGIALVASFAYLKTL